MNSGCKQDTSAYRLALRTLQIGVILLCGLLATLPGAADPGKGSASAAAKQSGLIQFNRDIRPILAENCFTCHGTDHNKRMANLRLDVRESGLAKHAFVPGHPEQSSLVARLFAKDQSKVMPPPYAHKHMTAAQRNLLREWVRQGAKYEKHWAFVPLPAQTKIPTVKNSAWVRNPIDRFVLARLEQEGVKPSPQTDRVMWLRRVSLDLIGIPPTPQEVDAFVADKDPNAYEKVVDHLLASPHFGERMALPWLDVARYADSYGYQSDQLCPTWPYRDWVVQAFNSNMPYDQFLTWQLAGDQLPNATQEQRLATAFNRLHRMTNEGGSVPEEWRVEGVADRVKTFGSAFLGLTTECARCHDHKYDPIPQRDYYALSGFFNNIDEYGLYDRADIVPSPSLLLPTPPQEQNLKTAQQAVQAEEKQYAQLRTDREIAFQAWLGRPQREVLKAFLPDMTGQFNFDHFEGAKLANLIPGSTQMGERGDEVPLVEGPAAIKNSKAAQLDGENNVHFPGLGRFNRSSPYTIAFRMRDTRQTEGAAVVYQACDGTDAGPIGYDLLIENGILTARMFRHWPGNAIAVHTTQPVPANTWTHVAVTYDGSSHAAGLRIYLDGKLAPQEILRDKMLKGIGEHTLVFGQRFRDRGFKGGRIADLAIFIRDISAIEVAQLFDNHSLTDALSNPPQHAAELRDYYLSALDPQTRQAASSLATARQHYVSAEDAPFEIAVMEEMRPPRTTYLLARGRYDAPKTAADRVNSDVPEEIFPFPKDLPRNRLGLTQWLLLPNHPLTARVAVNRLWALCFGRGLVETVEDFGVQGKEPTHPELLDWLARDFIQSHWDVKRMLKQMVLSNTYRQQSAVRPDLKERDPQNLLLARGPSHRLSAEAIRDTALAAAGLLDDRIGGPPVSPYQPGDLWRESNTMSPGYHQSVGKDLYRRSLYTVWKRTAPMPNMIAFDAGSREVCTARRQTTNTPLQALILLDDIQFVEAARVIAERTLKEGGPTPDTQIRYAFRLLAVREPTPAEQKLLLTLFQSQQQRFTADPATATQLIHIGDSKPDPALPPANLAAATVLAQTILNLDATVWNR